MNVFRHEKIRLQHGRWGLEVCKKVDGFFYTNLLVENAFLKSSS